MFLSAMFLSAMFLDIELLAGISTARINLHLPEKNRT